MAGDMPTVAQWDLILEDVGAREITGNHLISFFYHSTPSIQAINIK